MKIVLNKHWSYLKHEQIFYFLVLYQVHMTMKSTFFGRDIFSYRNSNCLASCLSVTGWKRFIWNSIRSYIFFPYHYIKLSCSTNYFRWAGAFPFLRLGISQSISPVRMWIVGSKNHTIYHSLENFPRTWKYLWLLRGMIHQTKLKVNYISIFFSRINEEDFRYTYLQWLIVVPCQNWLFHGNPLCLVWSKWLE